MTDQTERFLRDTFAADAEQAPSVHDLAGAARRQVHTQRRRRIAVAGTGLCVLGLVVGVVVTFGGGTPSSLPATDATKTASPETQSRPVLAFRGVHVPVPAAMLAVGSRHCGTALTDAAYVIDTDQATEACAVRPPHPELLTEVILQPWSLPEPMEAPPTGTRVLDDGRTQLVTRVPGREVRLIVTSPDPDRARRLFDGAELVNAPDGCAVRDSGDRTEPAANAPGPIAPPDARAGSVCGYHAGWLTQSHTLTAKDAATLAETLNDAPEGLSPRASSCPHGNDLVGSQEGHWLVRLTGDGGDTVISVYGGWCLAGGALNDSGRAARLTTPMITLLNSFATGPTEFDGVVHDK